MLKVGGKRLERNKNVNNELLLDSGIMDGGNFLLFTL